MFLDAIFWALVAVLACVGLVHLVAWVGIRAACKGNTVYKIVPIGGAGKNVGNQMTLLYTCLQWEANPSRHTLLLYDVGLDDASARDCQTLADASGVQFVRSPEALLALLAD